MCGRKAQPLHLLRQTPLQSVVDLYACQLNEALHHFYAAREQALFINSLKEKTLIPWHTIVPLTTLVFELVYGPHANLPSVAIDYLVPFARYIVYLHIGRVLGQSTMNLREILFTYFHWPTALDTYTHLLSSFTLQIVAASDTGRPIHGGGSVETKA